MRAFELSDLKEIECNTASVLVPEFGEDVLVYVREASAQDLSNRVYTWWRKRKERLSMDENDNAEHAAWVCAACMCAESGDFIAADYLGVNELFEKLRKQKATAIARIVTAASQLNGIGKAEVERIEKK